MSKNNIRVIRSPVYSPDYNPIEYMFSKLKNRVKQLRLQDMVKNKIRNHKVYVNEAVKEITIDNCNNYIKHCLKLFKIN